MLSAGLKAKHVGKQLLRVAVRAFPALPSPDDFSIVLEASDPDTLAGWVAPLSAAALEAEATPVKGAAAAAAAVAAGASPALAAFLSPTSPPAFGDYASPGGGLWPSGGASPAWQSLAFWDVFCDCGVRPELAAAANGDTPLHERLRAAFETVALALARLPSPRPLEARAAACAVTALTAGSEVVRQLPVGSADASRFAMFLVWFVNRVVGMRPGESLAMPGGWLTGSPSTSHMLVHVLVREVQGAYAFATINTGPGLEMHPWACDAETLAPKRAVRAVAPSAHRTRRTYKSH